MFLVQKHDLIGTKGNGDIICIKRMEGNTMAMISLGSKVLKNNLEIYILKKWQYVKIIKRY